MTDSQDDIPRTVYVYANGRYIGSFPEPTPKEQPPRFEFPREDNQ